MEIIDNIKYNNIEITVQMHVGEPYITLLLLERGN